MLDQKDLSNIFQIIERTTFSGKEIEEVKKLKDKIIYLVKTMPVVPKSEPGLSSGVATEEKASENA